MKVNPGIKQILSLLPCEMVRTAPQLRGNVASSPVRLYAAS